jgi:hypothetical protein
LQNRCPRYLAKGPSKHRKKSLLLFSRRQANLGKKEDAPDESKKRAAIYDRGPQYFYIEILSTKRIFGTTDFKVEMEAGCLAGAAYERNRLTFGNLVAWRNKELVGVRIERLRAVCMLDHDVVTIAAIPPAATFSDDNRTLSRGDSRRVFCCANINAVKSVEALGEHAAVDRP